jgi:hypothetical protein
MVDKIQTEATAPLGDEYSWDIANFPRKSFAIDQPRVMKNITTTRPTNLARLPFFWILAPVFSWRLPFVGISSKRSSKLFSSCSVIANHRT